MAKPKVITATVENIVTKQGKKGEYENWTTSARNPKYLNLFDSDLIHQAKEGETYDIKYYENVMADGKKFYNIVDFQENIKEYEGSKEYEKSAEELKSEDSVQKNVGSNADRITKMAALKQAIQTIANIPEYHKVFIGKGIFEENKESEPLLNLADQYFEWLTR